MLQGLTFSRSQNLIVLSYPEALDDKIEDFADFIDLLCPVFLDRVAEPHPASIDIKHAIKYCKAFFLLWNEDAAASAKVARELDLALKHRRTIVPFMLSAADLPDVLKEVIPVRAGATSDEVSETAARDAEWVGAVLKRPVEPAALEPTAATVTANAKRLLRPKRKHAFEVRLENLQTSPLFPVAAAAVHEINRDHRFGAPIFDFDENGAQAAATFGGETPPQRAPGAEAANDDDGREAGGETRSASAG